MLAATVGTIPFDGVGGVLEMATRLSLPEPQHHELKMRLERARNHVVPRHRPQRPRGEASLLKDLEVWANGICCGTEHHEDQASNGGIAS